MLTGNVLITGGAGFLGRGIMRRAVQDKWPVRFTVYSRNEQIQAKCKRMFPETRYILGDVRDTERLGLAMLGHDYVIHAAAMKFIPEGELNASECVGVNIDGARSVVSAARHVGVDRVVGISTDKAAQPVNIYGMTKAVMERLFADANYEGHTTFTTCRYGNVIGSTGSVVPVMMQQWHEERCVKITDPDMTRFWMSVDNAVDTIVQAAVAHPGVTIVPHPFSATMHDVAFAVLQYLDVPITDGLVKIVGRRPGEKMHEDLVSRYENLRSRNVGGYIAIYPPGNEDYANERPTISSDTAHHVNPQTLAEWIADAVTV